jgi:hypothetical protein
MFQEGRPRCANPQCNTLYHWTVSGRFFRFAIEQAYPSTDVRRAHHNLHEVEHFWLCDPCSRQYTLKVLPGRGIALTALGSGPNSPSATSTEERSQAA